MTGQDWLELGRIGSPYGIKGWVHVQSFTDPPERLLKYRDWLVQSGRVEPAAMKVAEGRAHGDGLVARLDGIDDRDRAAKLQGAAIRVARSALPKLKLDIARIEYWVGQGAQQSDRVKTLVRDYRKQAAA